MPSTTGPKANEKLVLVVFVALGLISVVALYLGFVAPNRGYTAVDLPTPEFHKRLSDQGRAKETLETADREDVSSLDLLPRVLSPAPESPPEQPAPTPAPATPPAPLPALPAVASEPRVREEPAREIPRPAFKPSPSLAESGASKNSSAAFLASPQPDKKEKEASAPAARPAARPAASRPEKSRDWRTPTGHSGSH